MPTTEDKAKRLLEDNFRDLNPPSDLLEIFLASAKPSEGLISVLKKHEKLSETLKEEEE